MSPPTSTAPRTARPTNKSLAILPARTRQAALPVAARPAFRVLQTRHAPAQLSLFLRPGLGDR
jgi:hypothetical protein